MSCHILASPRPPPHPPGAWVNAQIRAFGRLWERGRGRQQWRRDGAVAALRRQLTEAPARSLNAGAPGRGGRGELLDGRGPMGGSRPQPCARLAPGPTLVPRRTPHLPALLVSTCRLGGAAGRHSHNALGRAAAVAAASAAASGRRWRKAERRIWTSRGLTSRLCSKPRSGKGTPGEGKGLRWPRLPEAGGELGGKCGLVSFAGDRCGQVRRRPPWAAGFGPLPKCGGKDWTRGEDQGWWLVGSCWESGGSGGGGSCRSPRPPSSRSAAPTPGLPERWVPAARREPLTVWQVPGPRLGTVSPPRLLQSFPFPASSVSNFPIMRILVFFREAGCRVFAVRTTQVACVRAPLKRRKP